MTPIGADANGFYIYDDCNMITSSYSCLGEIIRFELPQGIQKGSNEGYSYLAGSQNFKELEIEVYKLEWKK